MDTALEALFKDMLTHGWFTKSDGHVDSPTGWFGYVTNTKEELSEIYDAFSDLIDAYGKPNDEDVIGSFTAYINSDGIIFITRHPNDATARYIFETNVHEYNEWEGN